MPPSLWEAHLRHAEYCLFMLLFSEHLYKKGGQNILDGLHLFDMERENIIMGQAWAANNSTESKEAAIACASYAVTATPILSLRLMPRERITWLETAKQTSAGNPEIELRILMELGSAYASMGDVRKSIQVNEQVLSLVRKTGNRLYEALVLGSLGNDFASLKDVSRATEFYEKQLAIARELGEREIEAGALINLGYVHSVLKDDTFHALRYLEPTLAFMRERGDLLGEAAALNRLGSSYWLQRKYKRAIEFYEKALRIHRELGDRMGAAYTLSHLGNAYRYRLRLGKARRFWHEAYRIFSFFEHPQAEHVQNRLQELARIWNAWIMGWILLGLVLLAGLPAFIFNLHTVERSRLASALPYASMPVDLLTYGNATSLFLGVSYMITIFIYGATIGYIGTKAWYSHKTAAQIMWLLLTIMMLAACFCIISLPMPCPGC